MNQNLANAIFHTAHITGTFTLRSGKISHEYFDKYLFESNPTLLAQIADAMLPLIPQGVEMLAGLEMGGIPVATMLSQKSGLPCLFVRKQAKEYGTCKLAEGQDFAGKRLLIVEDVVTTGGQIIESAAALRERGALVSEVVCVIQREPKATELLAAEGLRLIPAFTMEQLKTAAAGGSQ